MSDTEEKRSGHGQGESQQVSRSHSQRTGGGMSETECISRSTAAGSCIGIGPPSSVTVPRGQSETGDPEGIYTGDPEGVPQRSRQWPYAAGAASPTGRRWLIPPREIAAAEQQVLKAELARLAADPETAVAVAAGASSEEVWLVLPVRTGQLTEGAQAILRGPAARGGRSADTPKRPPPRL
jgi:hypothetical protein